jgi:DNA-binding NarL/FixJ family response regulator
MPAMSHVSGNSVDDERPITCLIAEDHALMRQAVAACLREAPAIELVGSAPDGETLLDLIPRRKPDAVITDLHMPGMNGIEVCRAVAERHPAVRVVLYTGDDDVDMLESALEAGASGFVVKSGPPSDLVRALRVAMKSQVYIDSSLVGALLARRAEPRRSPFSGRELEVLGLLTEGHTTDQIAAMLFLSPATVRSYAESAMHKLDARNRPHLVAKALRMGLLR